MIRKVITETILSNINLPTEFREAYKKVVLSEADRNLIETNLDGFNENEIQLALNEVNRDLVNYNTYVSKELTEKIIEALNDKSYYRLGYTIYNKTAYKLEIDDPQNNFPKIYLMDLDNYAAAEYNAKPDMLTIDILTNNDIDPYKIDYFIKNAYYLIAHEMKHRDTYELFSSIHNLRSLARDQQKPDIERFDELESFKQQLSVMTKMNLKTFMLKIMKKDPNKDLNTIFSEAVNSLIVEMFKQNTQVGSYLDLISYDYKKEIYKYIYSQAKETYLDDYYTFVDYYNLAKSGLL